MVIRDLTLEDPIRAIREISHDITCRREVRLANGRELSALDIQREYLDRALRYHERRGLPALEERALSMWQHCIEGIEKDPLSLDRECDWVIKHRLVEAYRARHQLPLGHPRVALLDLQYHDVDRSRGIFYLLQAKGPCGPHDHRRGHHQGDGRRRLRRPGRASGRVHQAGQGEAPRFHRRLGPPEAERPDPADGPFEGSVPLSRRARRAAHRIDLGCRSVTGCHRGSEQTADETGSGTALR